MTGLENAVAGDGPSTWVLSFGLTALAGFALIAISVIMARHLVSLGERHFHPLATATAFILFTAGGGHLVHAALLVGPVFGGSEELGAWARVHATDWHVWFFDGLSALAALTYLVMRRRLHTMVVGAGLYDDLAQRQRSAMTLHDNVVQHVVQARWSLDLDEVSSAVAIASASRELQKILDELEAELPPAEALADA